MPAKTKRPSPQVVSREQATAMLAAMPSVSARIAWALMFFLGLRVSEAIALDWADVDRKANRVTVLASKAPAGEDRQIPIPSPLRSILRDWQTRTGQRLGPVAPGVEAMRADAVTIRRNGHRAWKSRALPLHDARHTYASWLLASGHSLVEIRDVLGHANVRVTADYLHPISDPRDARLDRLDPSSAQRRDTSPAEPRNRLGNGGSRLRGIDALEPDQVRSHGITRL
jgi:integrase